MDRRELIRLRHRLWKQMELANTSLHDEGKFRQQVSFPKDPGTRKG